LVCFWTWRQRLAISIRNTTEGREVSEMHKAPGDTVEKLLLPKISLKTSDWLGSLRYCNDLKRLFLSPLSFPEDFYCK